MPFSTSTVLAISRLRIWRASRLSLAPKRTPSSMARISSFSRKEVISSSWLVTSRNIFSLRHRWSTSSPLSAMSRSQLICMRAANQLPISGHSSLKGSCCQGTKASSVSSRA